MLRNSILLLGVFLTGCAATVDLPGNRGGEDVLPLAVGNEWVYARTKFVRGSVAEHDTVRLRVIAHRADDAFLLQRLSQYSLDSLLVKRKEKRLFVLAGGEPFIGFSQNDTFTGLLIATNDIVPNIRIFSALPDTFYAENPAVRIREHVELMGTRGTVVLRMDFDHVFAEGIGQVAVRFVADINECLQCSLISEFWVYDLVRYNVQ